MSSGGYLGKATEHQERAIAEVIAMDSLNIDPGACPLIKMDVEGAETAALRGMSVFLQSRPIIIEAVYQKSCDQIAKMFPDYRYFQIKESGSLVENERIVPQKVEAEGEGLNHLLIPRERDVDLS